jgi:hypothetical protein
MRRSLSGCLACLAVLAGCSILAPGGTAMAADVVNPRFTTDRSVDTSSVEAMVKSLVKEGMSDQEKALAIYNYVRRTMFHYRYLTDFAGGGTMDMINGVGYCLCTPTAGTQARLCGVAGLKAGVLSTLGHGSVAVYFDDKWNWMDAFVGGCLWDQERKHLAALPEIVAQPALLKRENPSPVPLFPCGKVLLDDALRFEPGNEKYHKECGPDDADWATRSNPGKCERMDWPDKSSLAIVLRPGETYTRSWDHEPGMYFLFKTAERLGPPHHFCGVEAEQRDTINWPYWKPYVKEITSTDPVTGKPVTVKTGRYWANGRLVWHPDLAAPGLLDAFASARNARVDAAAKAIVPANPDEPAVLEWAVKCPYMLQGGRLEVACEGKLSASVRAKDKGQFEPMELKAEGGVSRGELRPFFAKAIGTRSYTLRLELSGQGARITALDLATVFQHNMYALPQLLPGKNEVTVAVGNPQALKDASFVVEYSWEENGKPRAEKREVDRSPLAFTIEVAGPDLPRMRALTLANRPAAKRNEKSER